MSINRKEGKERSRPIRVLEDRCSLQLGARVLCDQSGGGGVARSIAALQRAAFRYHRRRQCHTRPVTPPNALIARVTANRPHY